MWEVSVGLCDVLLGGYLDQMLSMEWVYSHRTSDKRYSEYSTQTLSIKNTLLRSQTLTFPLYYMVDS